MYTKVKIYNLAIQALLLSRQVIDANSDKSNEVAVFNQQWDIAFKTVLFDLDLDSTSTHAPLVLLHDFTKDPPTQYHPWKYVYQYPDKCAYFRRIVSHNPMPDDKFTHHPKKVTIWEGKKAIFAEKEKAFIEYIPLDFPLQTLSAPGGMAIATWLAFMSAPLIVGKGAKSLRETIKSDYLVHKAMAQELDARENFNFQTEENQSEFVKIRMS